MLHDLLATAWAISGALLLLAHMSKKKFLEDLFQTDTLTSRVIQRAVVIGLLIFAVSGLAGYPFTLVGMPMMHWFSALFLINLWFRAALLLVKKRTN